MRQDQSYRSAVSKLILKTGQTGNPRAEPQAEPGVASYNCFFANTFALVWWSTPHLGGSRTARVEGRAKSAHPPPIGCRPVAQPRVTVTMSFCEQGRSSFVHFSGPQEHNRTPSAPCAVIPLVEAKGLHMQGHPGEAWRQHGRNSQAGKE